ncbi:hypothetical protein [Gloeobacter kilaueensis]|uniref:Uncharacterized protein n=1 Tax=Gloeobacter kilaueensis (strain ATCC BAA-2537 / CCAP 1431/1 / ULC 316 / JS1) TaxID=1183438 RepID=U5QFA4_GLOK1|nr:hypothetical protein [Gloeobacter kilaueensis]AGY57652.1 hypothetical protein GKIL_1406 [Gloeobacter kilaueensis JS1]
MLTYARVLSLSEGGHFTPFAHLNHRIIRFLCHSLEGPGFQEEVLAEAIENAKLHFSLRSAVRAYEVFGSSYSQFIEQGVCNPRYDERLVCDLYAVYRRRLESDVADFLRSQIL